MEHTIKYAICLVTVSCGSATETCTVIWLTNPENWSFELEDAWIFECHSDAEAIANKLVSIEAEMNAAVVPVNWYDVEQIS